MRLRSPAGAVLSGWAGRAAPLRVVLLLPGGREQPDAAAVPGWWPPVVRLAGMLPHLTRGVPRTAAYLLRWRYRGWDSDAALADARWALQALRRQHPDLPIVPVGHSLGGRVALAIAGDPAVPGAVGLAPWLPAGEPVAEIAGRRLVLVHGDTDRELPVADTLGWARRAEVAGALVRTVPLPGGGHAMLARAGLWHRLSARAVRWVAPGTGSAAPHRSSHTGSACLPR